jgi:hypothetical protein
MFGKKSPPEFQITERSFIPSSARSLNVQSPWATDRNEITCDAIIVGYETIECRWAGGYFSPQKNVDWNIGGYRIEREKELWASTIGFMSTVTTAPSSTTTRPLITV